MAELVETPNLFTLNHREEKQLIRSRLRVVEEYNRMPGAHRLFMVAKEAVTSGRKGGHLYLPERSRQITRMGKYWK